MQYALQKNRLPVWTVGVITLVELLFFVLLIRQESLAVMFLAMLCGMIIIYLFPEASLSIAFTGNVLLYILYDYANIQIPFFSLIFGFSILIIGAFFHIEKNCYGKEIYFGELVKLSLAIAVLLILGLVYSTNRTYGMTKILLYLFTNVPLIIIIAFYRDEFSAIQRILFFNIIIGLILTILSFIAARDSILFGHFRFRLSENVGPLGVARPITISVVSAFFFIASKKNFFIRSLLVAAIAFMTIPVIWSGSRGPLLAIFFAALTFVVLQPRMRPWQKSAIILAFVLAGAAFLLNSTNQVSQRLATPISEEASAAFRVLAWIQSGNDFISHPITGIGTGSFYLDNEFVPLIYPHNLVLELAAENGVVGLALILLFFGVTAKYGLAAIKSYFQQENDAIVQLCIGAFALFINSWINAMVSGNITANSSVWLSAGLMWILYKSSQPGLMRSQ